MEEENKEENLSSEFEFLVVSMLMSIFKKEISEKDIDKQS